MGAPSRCYGLVAMKNVSIVIEDFCTIKKVICATLIASGYEVEPSHLEISEGRIEGTWNVSITFVVKRW
jgi:hypothetical protein